VEAPYQPKEVFLEGPSLPEDLLPSSYQMP
jgi:hypothetical protein